MATAYTGSRAAPLIEKRKTEPPRITGRGWKAGKFRAVYDAAATLEVNEWFIWPAALPCKNKHSAVKTMRAKTGYNLRLYKSDAGYVVIRDPDN